MIYVYHGARRQFMYTAEKYGFSRESYVKGIKPAEGLGEFASDLEKLRGHQRVWAVFSVDWVGHIDERAFLLQELDGAGTRLDGFEAPGVSVYLFDLSSKERAATGKGNRLVGH